MIIFREFIMKITISTVVLNIILSISCLCLTAVLFANLGKEKFYSDNIDKKCYEDAVCTKNGMYCPEIFKIHGEKYIEFNKSECEYYTDKNNRLYVRKYVLGPLITNIVTLLLLLLSVFKTLRFSLQIINILVILTGLSLNCYNIILFKQYNIDELNTTMNIMIIPFSIINALSIIIRLVHERKNNKFVCNDI